MAPSGRKPRRAAGLAGGRQSKTTELPLGKRSAHLETGASTICWRIQARALTSTRRASRCSRTCCTPPTTDGAGRGSVRLQLLDVEHAHGLSRTKKAAKELIRGDLEGYLQRWSTRSRDYRSARPRHPSEQRKIRCGTKPESCCRSGRRLRAGRLHG